MILHSLPLNSVLSFNLGHIETYMRVEPICSFFRIYSGISKNIRAFINGCVHHLVSYDYPSEPSLDCGALTDFNILCFVSFSFSKLRVI